MLGKRLSTYKNFKGNKTALQLAMAGFVYTGSGDKVMCECCGVRLFNWIGDEDPLEEHRKYSKGKGCKFIRDKFTISTGSDSVSDSTQTVPKFKQYDCYEARLRSFAGWPLKLPIQNPRILAQSGFFYIGSADRARCFHCGLTLRDWDDDDFPPAVHREWADDCAFANTLDVEQMRKDLEEKEFLLVTPTPKESDRSDTATHTSCYLQPAERVVSQATQDDGARSNYGHNPTIQAVLEMGYSIEVINKAIEKRKREQGSEFPNAEALFEVILEQEG